MYELGFRIVTKVLPVVIEEVAVFLLKNNK